MKKRRKGLGEGPQEELRLMVSPSEPSRFGKFSHLFPFSFNITNKKKEETDG